MLARGGALTVARLLVVNIFIPKALSLKGNPQHNVMTTGLFMIPMLPFLAAVMGFDTRQEGNATESLHSHMSHSLTS